jgi:hypothetical protein
METAITKAEMKAFDALPSDVREVLRYTTFEYNARKIL